MQGGFWPSAVASLNVSTVNDAPIVDLNGAPAGSSATLNYLVSNSATLIAPSATVADIDSANFGGGSLRVAITQNGTVSDQLSIATDSVVTITNGGVFVSGVKVGTILTGHT